MYILSISIYVLPSPGRSLPPLCRGLLDIFGAALEAELGGGIIRFPHRFSLKMLGLVHCSESATRFVVVSCCIMNSG